MKCPKCAYENTEDAPFCGLCYEVLKKAAPAPKPVPVDLTASPGLRKAMEEVCAGDSPENRVILYRELLKGVFLVPKTDHHVFEVMRPAPGENLDFPFSDLPSGGRGLAVFTGMAEFKLWRPQGCGFVFMRGKDMFCMAAHLGAPMVDVDPGSVVHGRVLEWEVRRLAEGSIPVSGPDGRMAEPLQGSIKVGELEKPLLPAFVADLWKLFAAQREVERIFAVQVSINDVPRRLALAVSCPEKPSEDRLSEFMPALVELAEAHRYDAYCVLAEEQEWGDHVMRTIKPVYHRA